MKNWANEIDKAAEKMIGKMVKAGFSTEKIELNKKVLMGVVENLKADLEKVTESDKKFYSYSDAKTYTKNVYGMAGKFADHGSMKHKIAHSLAQLM